MLGALSQRVLPVLQLTRMALVFTAISNTQCTLLLAARQRQLRFGGDSILNYLNPHWMLAIAVVSVGLYGFGMSLNDIIDRRRDRRLAEHRPLPSGRIGILTAHLICAMLASAALLAGAYYARTAVEGGLLSLLLVIWTGALIAFYDYAGKYLVGMGLLALGLIRFFHALIPSPHIPLVWHPLLLLDHVAVLSTVCYVWEEKRPALTKVHVWTVAGGLAALNLMTLAAVAWRGRHGRPGLWVTWDLLLPLAAAAAFVAVAIVVRRRSATGRAAGQTMMLYGLLWLIVYDGLFAAAYVSLVAGICLLTLVPVAYLSVQLMRWWAKLMLLPRQPKFRRV